MGEWGIQRKGIERQQERLFMPIPNTKQRRGRFEHLIIHKPATVKMDKKKISVLFLLETKSIYTEKRGKDIFTFFNIINTKSLTLMMKRRLE